MKADRLFEIIYILLKEKQVTAKELATRLEVSARTIYRDIDALSAAGVPVYAIKGKGGGICLLENYVLDRSLFSEEEQSELLSALSGLTQIQQNPHSDVLGKLSALFQKSSANWLQVDFASWGEQNDDLFQTLKQAILNKNIIAFDYYGVNGKKTSRRTEPLQLLFKHSAWYLIAHCLAKDDTRFFKLSRLRNLKVTAEQFERTYTPAEKPQAYQPEYVTLTLKIAPSLNFRVYDEFAGEHIASNEDGSHTVTFSMPMNNWIFDYIASFGSAAEVLAPTHIRAEMLNRLRKTLDNYL